MNFYYTGCHSTFPAYTQHTNVEEIIFLKKYPFMLDHLEMDYT